MRVSSLFLGCFLLFLVGAQGCGGSTEAPQDPAGQGGATPSPSGGSTNPAPSSPPPATTLPPPSGPTTSGASCGDFGGKIHGTSTCRSVDRQTAAIAPIGVRAGAPTVGVNCNEGALALGSMTVHLECSESTSGTGTAFTKHAVVTLVVDDDTDYPALKGRHLELDRHDGFWDFIHAWVGVRLASVEVTLDYGVLE